MGASETIDSAQIDEGALFVWHELPTDQFTASEIEDKVRHFQVAPFACSLDGLFYTIFVPCIFILIKLFLITGNPGS